MGTTEKKMHMQLPIWSTYGVPQKVTTLGQAKAEENHPPNLRTYAFET